MARKRTRLRTVGHVLSELGRQYRRADSGELPWPDAAAAARILREMRVTIEGDAFEQRLADLEARVAATPAKASNGAGRYAARA
jgi:hypothetical protein